MAGFNRTILPKFLFLGQLFSTLTRIINNLIFDL